MKWKLTNAATLQRHILVRCNNMGNRFDRLEARQSRLSDQMFGEFFTIKPMEAGINSRDRADASRATVASKGIWITGKPSTKGFGKSSPGHGKHPVCVSFDLRALPYRLKQGDQIYRQKTQQTYRIKSIDPDGEGRAKFGLNNVAGDD